MQRLVVGLLLAALLAGCTTDDAADPAPAEDGPELLLGERPDTTFGDVSTGPAVGPDLNATTAAAPRLVPGEWWRIQYEAFLGEELVEVVRVVADVNDDGYIFGMPHEGWLKEAVSFHAPAFGDVNFDLSYNTHNQLFSPVQFPLEQGATWETAFAAVPYQATVESADETTAVIVFDAIPAEPQPTDPVMAALGLLPGGAQMRMVYDAQQHEIVEMTSEIGTWRVIEHGYDYQGWVTVPRGHDTAIDYGTFGPASESHTPAPDSRTVAEGFNRMTMMHFVGTLGDAPAHLEARDVTPDGTEFKTTMTGSGFALQFYETNAPSGTWTVQDTTLGAGFTYHMGIAYFQYDIRLPDGARRADHSHEVIR
ncbi:MAG: hypothetical protein ACPGQL_03385 [Thermoplasmatota archaeon]